MRINEHKDQAPRCRLASFSPFPNKIQGDIELSSLLFQLRKISLILNHLIIILYPRNNTGNTLRIIDRSIELH